MMLCCRPDEPVLILQHRNWPLCWFLSARPIVYNLLPLVQCFTSSTIFYRMSNFLDHVLTKKPMFYLQLSFDQKTHFWQEVKLSTKRLIVNQMFLLWSKVFFFTKSLFLPKVSFLAKVYFCPKVSFFTKSHNFDENSIFLPIIIIWICFWKSSDIFKWCLQV